jgi:3-dehydroquinate dehydratase-2
MAVASENSGDAAWLFDLGNGLRARRASERVWRLRLIDGPNMTNLGARDPRTYGTTRSLSDLHAAVEALAEGLGVSCTAYTSNHEGDIVSYIYDHAAETDGFLINPAGGNSRGEPAAQALADSGKPFMELHFANVAASGWPRGTVVTTRAAGTVMGLRQYSYLAAVFGLVLYLDASVKL